MTIRERRPVIVPTMFRAETDKGHYKAMRIGGTNGPERYAVTFFPMLRSESAERVGYAKSIDDVQRVVSLHYNTADA